MERVIKIKNGEDKDIKNLIDQILYTMRYDGRIKIDIEKNKVVLGYSFSDTRYECEVPKRVIREIERHKKERGLEFSGKWVREFIQLLIRSLFVDYLIERPMKEIKEQDNREMYKKILNGIVKHVMSGDNELNVLIAWIVNRYIKDIVNDKNTPKEVVGVLKEVRINIDKMRVGYDEVVEVDREELVKALSQA